MTGSTLTVASPSRPFGGFELGLTAEQERHATELHASSIVIDLMYWGPLSRDDFPVSVVEELQGLLDSHGSLAETFRDAFEVGGRLAVTGQMPAFRDSWLASGVTAGHYPLVVGSTAGLLRSAAHLTRLVDGLPWVRKVCAARDIREAKRDGHLAYFGMCQPYEPISRDLALLEAAYDLGLRVLNLTYNTQDFVGSGCTDRTDGGLSLFGLDVVRWCNDSGVVVDTAHSGKRTTFDACAASTAPVIASHTAAHALHAHARCKTDEELRAIAGTGGVIGIATVPTFIGDVETVDLNRWLDHVEHMVEVVGIDHVAIGTDHPLMGPAWSLEQCAKFFLEIGFREEHGLGDPMFNMPGWDSYRDMPNVTRGLVSRGYSDADIRAILGDNVLRVFEQVLG